MSCLMNSTGQRLELGTRTRWSDKTAQIAKPHVEKSLDNLRSYETRSPGHENQILLPDDEAIIFRVIHIYSNAYRG